MSYFFAGGLEPRIRVLASPRLSVFEVFGLGVWLGIALLAGAPASAQVRLPLELTPTIENVYLQTLEAWARGSTGAVRELSNLQQRLASHKAGFEITRESFFDLPLQHSLRPLTNPDQKNKQVMVRALPGSLCMNRLQEAINERLSHRDPETLVPLSYLQQQIYADQMGPVYRPWLAPHSRRRAFQLINRYLEVGQVEPETRRTAVSLLVGFAELLSRANALETGLEARDVFRRVLVLQPDHQVALYWVAYLEERLGNYREVIELLAVPENSAAEDPELALRLAINRARVGHRATAIRELETISRGNDEAWLRIVAYQELGRLHAESPSQGVAYLREGARRFPANSRLQVQLSNLAHDDWETTSLWAKEAEARSRSDPGTSPRFRYSEARREEIEAELLQLEGEVTRRQTSLADALEAMWRQPLEGQLRIAGCPREITL